MAKIVLQFTEYLSATQQKKKTSELSRLCKLLGVEFELYGKFDDFDIYLPEDYYRTLHLLNILQSFAILNKIATKLVP